MVVRGIASRGLDALVVEEWRAPFPWGCMRHLLMQPMSSDVSLLVLLGGEEGT